MADNFTSLPQDNSAVRLSRGAIVSALYKTPSQAPDGSLAAPTRGFSSDAASGWYKRPSDGAHVYVMDGIEALWLKATGSLDGQLLVAGALQPITLSSLLTNGGLTPQMFGAKANGTGSDSAAFSAWFAAILETGLPGLWPAGHYALTQPLNLDIGTVLPYGVLIRTHGPDQTILDFSGYGGGNGPALFFGTSAANGASFYSRIDPIRVNGNMPGVMVMIGRENFSDALNSVSLSIFAQNGSTDTTAVAVEVNGAYQCRMEIVANGSGKNTSGGVSLKIRQAQFCEIECSAGNNYIGMQLVDGAVFGNAFLRTDLEECHIGLQVPSTGTNVRKNTFVGGTIADCDIGVDTQAGSATLLENVNNAATTRLAGTTGLYIIAPDESYVSTPPMSASGATTTNTSGQPASVAISGGTVTAVVVNGATLFQSTNCTVILRPGDTLALTYPTGSAPGWTWLPL